jgi:hypothetical protein
VFEILMDNPLVTVVYFSVSQVENVRPCMAASQWNTVEYSRMQCRDYLDPLIQVLYFIQLYIYSMRVIRNTQDVVVQYKFNRDRVT